ncbi:FCD domain-containing protein [Pseudooceanicola sp. GBMRC 2024]|uniref:FCD domain-containing protein n=1 Tax=Pseudooceanicola albus TaxID=2692189 RepID=A0A6L7G1F0_9RHOB|nr:GntR family transcriptional regulator [Pseudooceanicola albus]MXN17749.1 FCD domain-containing protein [Pseudooceanicola albus]
MSSQSLSAGARTRIIAMILEGELKPGDALQAEKLAQQLGMSRTPVREAIRRIESEGLAEQQGRFLRVRALGPAEVEEIFFLRLQLETRAARAAVALPRAQLEGLATRVGRLIADDGTEDLWQVDDAFHGTLAGALGNRTISTVLEGLRRRSSMFDSAQVPGRYGAGSLEHMAILEALMRGDGAAASDRMATHLCNARDAILARLGELDRRKTAS